MARTARTTMEPEPEWRLLATYRSKKALSTVYVLEQVRNGKTRLRSLHLGSPNVTAETVMQWSRVSSARHAVLSGGAAAALCALALRARSCGRAHLALGPALGAAFAAGCALYATILPKWHLDACAFTKPYAAWTSLGFALVPWMEEGSEVRGLMIGLGGGSLVHFWRKLLPCIALDVVEISPEVVAAARDHFGITAGGGLAVHCEDGADFVAAAPANAYRIAMCDLDVGTLDAHCAQFRHALSDDGVLMMNIFLEVAGARRLLHLSRALQAVLEHFEEAHIVRTGPRNSMIVALPRATGLDREGVGARAAALCARAQLPFDLAGLVAGSESYAIRRRIRAK